MASSAFTPLPASAARGIAAYSLTPSEAILAIQTSQTEHRIRLINRWRIPRGSRVLEIGCGQGDCTGVLAEAVGPDGHVDAVDPGPRDYGAPFPLGQAQDHLSASAVGGRIAWHRADPVDYLGGDQTWDVAVLAHCIWYFDRTETLGQILRCLRGRVTRVLVAEYALRASVAAARPHVLAAVARASLEAHSASSQANIRCMASPRVIKAVAAAERWALEAEDHVVPDAGLLDGHWEAGAIRSAGEDGWDREIEQAGIREPRVVTMLSSSRDAVVNAMDELEAGEKTRTMDVWVGSFH